MESIYTNKPYNELIEEYKRYYEIGEENLTIHQYRMYISLTIEIANRKLSKMKPRDGIVNEKTNNKMSSLW